MIKICDSIAVKSFPDNHILLAVGNELRYHGPTSFKILPWKLKGKIHGIDLQPNHNLILIYGEREFLLISYKKNDFQLLYRGKITDWISSGKWLSDYKFCLVCGHLTVIELMYDIVLKTCTIINKSYCPDKTTLYCSYILGNSWNDIYVFGGTAMDVIVFQPLNSEIIQRLSGKNGVTLSIDVNEQCNMMVTTSDDRSLKIYDLSIPKTDNNSDEKILSVSTESFIQSYGHTARVFQGKIIVLDNLSYILTAGEDSNICVWNQKGELLFKRLHHFGSPIWSIDYDYQTDTIFTTSSDGNCIKYNLKFILEPNLIKFEEAIENLDISNEGVPKLHKLDKIAFLCSDLIIIGLTNKNDLIAKIDNGKWIPLEKLLESNINCFPLLKNKCSILKTYKNQIAIGAFNTLLIIKYDINSKLFKIEYNDIVSRNYIKSIFFLNEEEYFVCDEVGNCKLFLKKFTEEIIISIPKCREPWITYALKFEKYILLSNRQGTLLLYVIDNNSIVLKDCLKKVNGNFGITNICLENNFETTTILKTYGHDNTIKILMLDKKDNNIKIVSRENISVVWVEKVINYLEENYIIGFNSTDFILWCKSSGELFNYNCGGGHRFWDIYVDFKKFTLKLIFIKKGKLCTIETQFKCISNNLVDIKLHNWHIKETNILKLIKIDNIQYLVSGGEDNIIKISKLEECSSLPKNEFSIIKEMNQHISSIKTIVIYKINEKLLIFTAGGRAQICITEFNKNTLNLEEKCNFMLKSTDFDRNFNGTNQQIDFNPETRIMSIDILCNAKNEIEIFAGCSDGYIRKFIFSKNNIQFVDELLYNKCLLHVKVIKNCILITASTDGTIKFWNILDFSSNSKFLYDIKHHDSGIHSIDILEKDRHIFIITGGDDQKIVYSKVEHNEIFKFKLIKTIVLDFVHTAQVTGVQFTKDLNYFYSTSVDQTVCKFCLQTNSLIERLTMCVADIKGLQLIDGYNNKINGIVYGCGLESF